MVAYISENANKRIIQALEQEGFEVQLLAPFSALAHPVDTHADMLLCAFDNVLFMHKDYPLEIEGFEKLIRIDEKISAKYPNDVLLNIAIAGKNAFANVEFASKTVLEYLQKNGYEIHHVKQGYAHCSTCIVSEGAIITADKGIAQEAQKAGIDALIISEGHISLPPYNHGFIGGCCSSYKGKIYFSGSLNYHPDGEKIRQFCISHGKEAVELCDAPLFDVGGIMFK